MNPPKMPIHIGDYRRDTGHLRTAGHGAYLMLMFHYWSTGGLPDDDDQLSAIAGMTNSEWRKHRPILVRFFKEGWKHPRIDADLEAAKASYGRRAEAGQKGGKAKAESKQCSSNATAGPEQPYTLNQIPEEKKERSLRSRSARGSRLSDDWMPDVEDHEFAKGLIGEAGLYREIPKFRDYWHARAGPGAVKVKWSATWRNWCRKAAEDGGGKNQRNGSNSGGSLIAAIDEMRASLAGGQNQDVVQLLPPRQLPRAEIVPGSGGNGFGAVRRDGGCDRDQPFDRDSTEIEIPAEHRGTG